MSPRIFVKIYSLLLILMLAAVSCDDSANVDQKLDLGGDFILTDHNGQPFDTKSLRGKPYFLYFGYTLCPDACPFTMSKLRRVYKILGEEKMKGVKVLFVSIDPERDGADKLKKYLSYFDIDALGLTGSPEEVKKAADLYNAKYEKVDSDSAAGYLMDHSTYTYLIDGTGKLRYRFRHKDSPTYMAKVAGLIIP